MRKYTLFLILLLFIGCVQINEEITPEFVEDGVSSSSDLKVVIEEPETGSVKIDKNFLDLKWTGYDKNYLPSQLEYQILLDESVISSWSNSNGTRVTHLEKGTHDLIVKCRNPKKDIDKKKIFCEVITPLENDYDPPQILGSSIFDPHHSTYFLYSLDYENWLDNKHDTLEIYPDTFVLILNWDFCFQDPYDQTPLNELTYYMKVASDYNQTDWIDLGNKTEISFSLQDIERFLNMNIDKLEDIKFRIKAVDNCGNESRYIEKIFSLVYALPELSVSFFEWNNQSGEDYFINNWDNYRALNIFPAVSLVLKNQSDYSAEVFIQNEFKYFYFQVISCMTGFPVVLIRNEVNVFDCFDEKYIENMFYVYPNQEKEIVICLEKDFSEFYIVDDYGHNLSDNEVLELIFRYDKNFEPVSTVRLDSRWYEDKILAEDEGFYKNYPYGLIEKVFPELEMEMEKEIVADYDITLKIKSVGGISEDEIIKNINYNLYIKTSNR